MIKELQPIRKEGNDLAIIAPDEYGVLWRMDIEEKINELVRKMNEIHDWCHRSYLVPGLSKDTKT